MPVELGATLSEVLLSHVALGAQRQADGAGHYAENLRYDYLEGKDAVSASEAVGERRMDESGAGRARQTTNEPPANR